MARKRCSTLVWLFVSLTVVTVAALGALPAAAQESDVFLPGVSIDSATVTGPSLSEPRTLDTGAANEFMRSWFAASIVGRVEKAEPPKGTPVYKIKIQFTADGTGREMTAWYASSGSGAWVGMPKQDIMPGLAVTDDAWIVAPANTQQVIADLDLPTASASELEAAPTPSSPDDDSFPWLAVVLGSVALVAVVAGAVTWRSRRSRRSEGSNDPGDTEPDSAPAVHA